MKQLYFGLFASLLATSAYAAEPAQKKDDAIDTGSMTATQAINFYIKDGYTKAAVKSPAAKASDLEFMRRLYIDLIGRIPTPAEILDFEAQRTPDKRVKFIRRLLYESKNSKGETAEYVPKILGRPVIVEVDDDGKMVKKELSFDYPEEYAEHWANMWTVWLMSRTTHPTYRQQMHAWLANQFSRNTPYNEITKKLLTATGNTQKDGAVNFILHHLGDPNPAERRKELGHFDAVPITSRVTRLFLGLQTQCTQCHDHPFNKEWIQSDFWGVNGFFRQTDRSVTPTPRPGAGNNNNMMGFVQVDLLDDASSNPESKIYYEPRNGTTMATKPVFLKDYAQAEKGEKSMKKLPSSMEGKTRRQLLADYVVAHDNYAKAYVNRIWGHLFGRGLAKDPTIDDFGSHNEVIHPELLEKLAGDFAKYNYDPKMLLEWICSSDVYSLSHVAVKDYIDQKYDPYFARMPLKAMSPEVLYECLSLATKAEGTTTNRQTQRGARENWLEKLVRNFGDDEGNELTFNGTVVQALLMLNGKELNDQVMRKSNSTVEQIMKKHNGNFNGIIDELYLASVSRHATAAELKAILEIRNGIVVPNRDAKPTAPVKGKPAPNKGGGKVVSAESANDVKFYQDVFWALLNTTEFMLNH